MHFHSHPASPFDLDAAFSELTRLVEEYGQSQPYPLPTTTVAALKEICRLMEEIELHQLEGHTPFHHEIPWRVAHIMLCVCLVEKAGWRDGSARSLARHLLDQIGVSVASALEIAAERLRRLTRGEDAEHVDTSILVPLMKHHLHHR